MLSVIIPTFNSYQNLQKLLPQISTSWIVKEIIISDGGSNDSTLEIAQKFKLIKAFKSQFSSMSAAYAYSPSALKTTNNYLIRIKSTIKNSSSFSLITFLLLFPALIKGRFISRKPFENQLSGNPRKIFEISLLDLEKKYIKDYGKLNLNKQERDIFINY